MLNYGVCWPRSWVLSVHERAIMRSTLHTATDDGDICFDQGHERIYLGKKGRRGYSTLASALTEMSSPVTVRVKRIESSTWIP